MPRILVTAAGLAALLLAGCRSGGADEAPFCEAIGGGGAVATEVCSSNCNQQDIAHAVDARFGTYARIGVSVQNQGAIRGTAQDGVVFPAGTYAGIYLHKPRFVNGGSFELNINTYLDGAPVDSELAFAESGAAGGETFCNFRCAEHGPNLFIGIPASGAFDAIELVYSQTGTQFREIRAYEFCTQD